MANTHPTAQNSSASSKKDERQNDDRSFFLTELVDTLFTPENMVSTGVKVLTGGFDGSELLGVDDLLGDLFE